MKVSVALAVILVGAGWSSTASAQALPPTVAAPVREWRACAEHIINAPYNTLTLQLRIHAAGPRACTDQRNRTQAAIEALPPSELTFEAVELYIEGVVQRAYDARRTADRATDGRAPRSPQS